MANPWWVWYDVMSGKPAQVIQEPNAGAVQNATGFPPLAGPFKTKSDAQAYVSKNLGNTTSGNVTNIPKDIIPSFSLVFKNISGWFMRGLKVLFGGILIILGISHLTGLDNKVTQLASNVKVLPV